jgi:hypothetical protein
VKKANEAIVSGDLNAAREAVRAAIVALDKAAQKGVLHPNNSARHKSRLFIKFNAAVAVQQMPGSEIESPKKARAKKQGEGAKGSKKAGSAKKSSAARKAKK